MYVTKPAAVLTFCRMWLNVICTEACCCSLSTKALSLGLLCGFRSYLHCHSMRCQHEHCSLAQYSSAQRGKAWHGTGRYGTERYGTEPYGTERYGTEPYGTERYGTERYGTAQFSPAPEENMLSPIALATGPVVMSAYTCGMGCTS